jgi:hypothetical protein
VHFERFHAICPAPWGLYWKAVITSCKRWIRRIGS